MKPGLRLFVYGTLLTPGLRRRLLGRRVGALPALLPDHAARPVRGAPWPGLVPCPGQRTRGALLAALCRRDLARLDAFEGAEYRRIAVTVRLADGRALDAQAYAFDPARHYRLARGRWTPGPRP